MNSSKRKYYFASDFHFGIPDNESSLSREKLIAKWLDSIKGDAKAIYLLGDVFDFWFEYTKVVPKGYVRVLAKMAEIIEEGVPIYLYKGNHDLWAFSYLNDEIGIQCCRKAETITLNNKKIHLAHGDGLGPGDYVFKFLLRVFSCRLNQLLFRWIHPDLGIRMGLLFSKKHRYAKRRSKNKDLTITLEKEQIYKYALDHHSKNEDIDYYIFGHRHIPVHETIKGSRAAFILLGDWMYHNTYGVLDENGIFELKKFTN